MNNIVKNNLAVASGISDSIGNVSERKSTLGNIRSITSSIANKVKNIFYKRKTDVVSDDKNNQRTVQNDYASKVPSYKEVSLENFVSSPTMVYQPPTAVPFRRQNQTVNSKVIERSVPNKNNDIFGFLDDKISYEPKFSDPISLNGNIVKNRVNRVMEKANTKKLEQLQLKSQFVEQKVNKNVGVNPPLSIPKLDTRESYSDYVASLDKSYYAGLAERRSRGLWRNLSLWGKELKKSFVNVVAPNYYINKSYSELTSKSVLPSSGDAGFNNYVASLDKTYYAGLAERRSRGLWRNLSLWGKELKKSFVNVVAPNYYINKSYKDLV